MIGPTSPVFATPFVVPKPPRIPFGVHPVWMKKAVMIPQAMKAGMFGMTIPLRNVPNRWMRTLAPDPEVVAA
jgi:hypothetical protein